MKIGAMLSDVLGALFKRPATERYPFERKPAPERLRGQLIWEPGKCAGCMLCVRDCPSDAIELVVIDKAAKRFVMRYHADRCTFCAQCVESCRFECLGMSNQQWELASIKKEPFTVYYGSESDIQFIMDRASRPGVEPSGE